MKQHLLLTLVCLFGMASSPALLAQNPLKLIVTSSADDANARDASPGDGECSDSNGRCTLRAAVDEANANTGEVIIVLPGRLPGGNSGNYTLSRVAPNMAANTYEDNNEFGDLDLNGSFASLWIQGTGTPGPKLSSSPNDRILDVGAGKMVKLTRLWVTGGTARAGDNGDSSNPDGTNGANGGALRIGSGANVTIDQAAFTGNFTQSGGNGAVPPTSSSRTKGGDAGDGGDGGAIYISTGATVTINRTTIEGNGTGDAGGAASGQANTGSNPADGGTGGDGGNGGGIYNAGTLTLKNSTITNNTLGGASAGGGGVNGGASGTDGNGGSGGGIANAQYLPDGLTDQGAATISNSIIAGNSAGQSTQSTPEPGPDLFDATQGSTFTQPNDNLIGDNGGVSSLMGLYIGTPSSPVNPNITGVNSNANFAVPTAVLGSGSVAIDNGSSTAPDNYDSRGFERPFGGGADIGASEFGSRPVTTSIKIVEADVNSSNSDDEFVEIKNTGAFPVQMDDHVLIGFDASGTSCLAVNMYGELAPGELFTIGESAVNNIDQRFQVDLVANNCGSATANLFSDDNGAVALYNGGAASIGAGFMAGGNSAQREDVIVFDNSGSGGSGSSLMDLCGAFGLSSGCAATDPGDGASIQVDANGNVYTGAPSPGEANSGSALPVEFGSLYVRSTAPDRAELSWETLTEVQNAGFEIEQLVDARWEAIGWVAGNGTTQRAMTYRFEVTNLTPGTHTFRLQQEDYDGTRVASEVVSVTLTSSGSTSLTPNPTHTEAVLTLDLPADEDRLLVSLLDGQGRVLRTIHNGTLTAGTQTLVAPVEDLQPGLYMLRVQGRSFNEVLPLQRL